MGSPISFTGLASGLDTASIVSALVNVESLPIRRFEQTQSELQDKSSKLTEINALLTTLQESADSLTSLSDISTRTASSSQETAVTATADGSAALGTYDILVTQHATTQRSYSTSVADPDTAGLLTSGTLSIAAGADTPVTLTIDGTTTLNTLATAINSSGANVSAGVFYDGSGYRLLINGNETGDVDGAIDFSGGSVDLGLSSNTVAPLAASFDIILDPGNDPPTNTFNLESQSNTVTNAIPGVTLELLGATADSATITVTADTTALVEAVNGFVTAYNDAVTKVNESFTDQNTDLDASLFGDSTLRMLLNRMSMAVIEEVSGISSDYPSASSIGLSIDRYGTLTLDEDTLNDAIADDPNSVATLFAETTADGSDGLMARLVATLETFTDSFDGLIPARIDGIDGRIRDLDDQIARVQLHVDAYEQRLNTQFIRMEQVMSSLQAQQNQLSAMLSGLNQS